MLVAGMQASRLEGLEDVKDMFAMNTVTAFDETSHLGEFFEWLRDSEQLAILETDEYGVKSKFVTVKAFHERYVYWVKEHGNKQDKNEGLNYKEFNALLRTNYGWESVNVAGLRWAGRVLKDAVNWSP
jgi:hypothetical protein